MKNSTALLFLFILILGLACQSPDKTANQSSATATFVGNKEFDEYWYRGEAELNSYALKQARYGEIHTGEAVLVFVTEPFSKSKQVKLDNPEANPKDEISVMKLNLTKKFYTGVYPYSIMQSSFTPIALKEFPNTLKVTASSQEWCGHTFTQLNLNKQGFQVQHHSYFESEGEMDQQIEKAFLEDEIWSRIRINPATLPTGNFKMIPGSIYSRLRHTEIRPQEVTANLSPSSSNKDHLTYQVEYGKGRQLSIHFSKNFPHIIQGWEESYTSGFGANAKTLKTSARLKKTLMLDYWNKHDVKNANYREILELTH